MIDRVGRLSEAPDPVLFELLYEPHLEEDRRHVLPHLLRIDAAHVVMLGRCRILRRDVGAALLVINRELAAKARADEDPLGRPASHRGLYLLYERRFIEELGPSRGGAAHVARSRNDINATVTRMRLRDELMRSLPFLFELVAVTLSQARRHLETLMPGMTHLQPAQPTSLGHYFAGVAAEWVRSLDWLEQALATTDRCPMGAAAGFGTSFPIDRDLVAALLGFSGVVDNSLDAVASRDYAVQTLSALAALGVSLSRVATDLQMLGGFPFRALDWPDRLVSTSSIMPQKRNPYVLEDVRGQATAAIGALVNLLTGMKNVPFSNSVEVSGEATGHLWGALASNRTAVRLMCTLLAELRALPARMRQLLDGSEVTMTALADLLVAETGVGFREAHEIVARLVREGDPASLDPTELRARVRERLAASEVSADFRPEVLREALDPRRCVARAREGGGPAPDSVGAQVDRLEDRLEALRGRLSAFRGRLEEADRELERAIEAALAEAPSAPAARRAEASGGGVSR